MKYGGEFDNYWDSQSNFRVEQYDGEFDNDWKGHTKIYVVNDNAEIE